CAFSTPDRGRPGARPAFPFGGRPPARSPATLADRPDRRLAGRRRSIPESLIMAKPVASRGLRDEMNVGPDPRSARQLVPLRELGKFRIADGEPDVRGWTAFTSTGREIGRVHELLVDTDARQVVMLDIDLRRDDRHTLVPIRASWVDQATRRVVVDAAEVTTGDELPALDQSAAAAARPPEVLADWQPARRPVAPDAPALAARADVDDRADVRM